MEIAKGAKGNSQKGVLQRWIPDILGVAMLEQKMI